MRSRGVATPEDAAKLGIPGSTWVIWHPKPPAKPQTEKPIDPKPEKPQPDNEQGGLL